MAEKLTTLSKSKDEVCDDDGDGVMVEDEEGADTSKKSKTNTGMLPNDIVNLLAAREKYVYLFCACKCVSLAYGFIYLLVMSF